MHFILLIMAGVGLAIPLGVKWGLSPIESGILCMGLMSLFGLFVMPY